MSRPRKNPPVFKRCFLRERVEVGGKTVPAAVDVGAHEIILMLSDLPDDAGASGEIVLAGRTFRCRPWVTAKGTDYLIVEIGTNLPMVSGLVDQ